MNCNILLNPQVHSLTTFNKTVNYNTNLDIVPLIHYGPPAKIVPIPPHYGPPPKIVPILPHYGPPPKVVPL